jgi:hypothetical protein
MVAVEERRVHSLRGTEAGSRHDNRIGDEAASTCPPGGVLLQETGVQGDEPDLGLLLNQRKSREGTTSRPQTTPSTR